MDFEAMVADYIAQAPPDNGAVPAHLAAATRRFHSAAQDNPAFLATASTLYASKLATPSISHPRNPTLHMWNYKYSSLKNDRRVSYQSAKYPWIEAAHRYAHLEHLLHDLDLINMQLPAFQGINMWIYDFTHSRATHTRC